MGRPVVLSNGQLFVGLDENGLVHDFYYPYVGIENLTNARNSQHKIGVWVDGNFSWTDQGDWQKDVKYEDDALISHITMTSEALELSLVFQDFIDSEYNTFIRRITVNNLAGRQRDIRLFMHQVFQISRAGRADTALYVPDGHYILDYKGRYSLAISGKIAESETSFDQFAVGNYGIESKAGTFVDAEDGELSGNAVEHGGVDSVIRFKLDIQPKGSEIVNYWIISTSSQSDSQAIDESLKKESIENRLRETRQFWQAWLGETDINVPTEHKIDTLHSLLIIKAHADDRGSILASGDSSIFNYGRDYYCYCWPRDAAYAIWPLIRLGHFDEAKSFFEFARDTAHHDGYLMHKYQPDRAIGSTWHPLIHGRNKELAIQEDETASVIFMIGEFYKVSKDRQFTENIFHSFVVKAANFIAKFYDNDTNLPHASYDLWEQKFQTSTYTVCTVISGLETAALLAQEFEAADEASRWTKAAQLFRDNLDKLFDKDNGYFIKGFLRQDNGELQYDNTLDISNLYGPFMYSGLDLNDDRIIKTAAAIESRLYNTSPIGGVIRYEQDGYFLSKPQYKGNPWIVCTAWLAQYFAARGDKEKAKQTLEWCFNREMPSGALSEQFDPEDGTPMGVTPLVWSHAELVNTILDISGSSTS